MSKILKSKFVLGLITGILISVSLYELSGVRKDKITTSEKNAIEENAVDLKTNVTTKSVKLTESERRISKSNGARGKNKNSSFEIDQTESEVQEIDKNLSSKSKIVKIINEMNEKDLEIVHQMLENYGKPLPQELFESEPIDQEWALKKQAELEYGFYSESPLRDKGELDSIQCRSQYCRVTVKVPRGTKLKASDTRDWGNPVSVSRARNNDDPAVSKIELYISRVSIDELYKY